MKHTCDKCKQIFDGRREGCVAMDVTLCEDCLASFKEKIEDTRPEIVAKLNELAKIKKKEFVSVISDEEASCCCAICTMIIQEEMDFEKRITERIEKIESSLVLEP